MFRASQRVFAAAAIVGFTAAFVGLGVALSNADEPKTADLTELRDAIQAAGKRGQRG